MFGSILVLDCETTGLDPATEAVVEVAAVLVNATGIQDFWHSLVNPGRPIPAVSRAIHHLSDEDVATAPCFTEAMLTLSGRMTENVLAAAHFAAFDSGFFRFEIPICTWRCATHLWPDAPSHGNQVLRYWLDGLNSELLKSSAGDTTFLAPPHRALPDAWVTAHIVRRMLQIKTPLELRELTRTPILHKKFHFGMHRGVPIPQVPRDYLLWLLRQKDVDPDVAHTCRHYLDISPLPSGEPESPRKTGYL